MRKVGSTTHFSYSQPSASSRHSGATAAAADSLQRRAPQPTTTTTPPFHSQTIPASAFADLAREFVPDYAALARCALVRGNFDLTRSLTRGYQFPYTHNNCYFNATMALLNAIGVL